MTEHPSLPPSKACCRCGEVKPLTDFYRETRVKDGRAGACKTCWKKSTAASQRAWYEKMGKDAARAYQRARWLKSKYGITPEVYLEMFERQLGVCAICRHPEPIADRLLAVDHHHGSGLIRGLLCSTCNTGLGKFRDNPALLRMAAEYVESGVMGVFQSGDGPAPDLRMEVTQ